MTQGFEHLKLCKEDSQILDQLVDVGFELDQLEYLKLCILTGIKPFMEIDADTIKAIIDSNTRPSDKFNLEVENSVSKFTESRNRKPSVDEMRYIYASTFASLS